MNSSLGNASKTAAGATGIAFTAGLAVAVGIGMSLGVAAPAMCADEPLQSIGSILALPDQELAGGRPAVVRGVVTIATPHVVIDDGSHAIRVFRRHPPGEAVQHRSAQPLGVQLEVGSEVEVSGVVDYEDFEPRLLMRSIRTLGTRPLPEPAAINFTRLFAGADSGRRVRTTGVVQAILDNPEGWSLIFESASRRIRVVVDKALVPSRPDAWVDAEMEIVGVCESNRNNRGEFLAPKLFVGKAEDLQVVRAPVPDPFALPMTPLNRVAGFRLEPLSGHRLRTSGIISFIVPDMLYLQDGIGGVRVELAPGAGDRESLQAGDRVEVAGFPDVRSGIGAISWAVARKVSGGPEPTPVEIQPREILRLNGEGRRFARPGSYDGCLIRCRGRLDAVNRSAVGLVLTLIDDGSAFTATLLDSKRPDAMPALPGSEVEVVGIVKALRKGPGDGDLMRGMNWLGHIDILLRSEGDVRLVRPPPWWTPERLMAFAIAAGSIVVAAGIWVATLRRQVARQTARAVAEESVRYKAAIDYEITLRERNRLAANLHDTILQTVTGIGYQLQACQVEQSRTTGARTDRLEVARKMVNHAAEQLRGTVWALHSPPIGTRSLVLALEERLARLREGFDTPVDISFTGRERRLSDTATFNLVLVAQEAVANALRHAEARTIEVGVAFGDSEVSLVVHDDGLGCDMTMRPGPSEGHFGIEGMIDRMQAFGGTCTFLSIPGDGTTVTAKAPYAAMEDHLSDRTGGDPANHGSIGE